jgi:hypothetical protein
MELERLTEGKGILKKGQWIHFRDSNGNGFAQPDFVLQYDDLTIILDAKLTHTPLARPQLEKLYKPLISSLLPENPVICIEVCHNAASVPTDEWIRGLDEIYEKDLPFYIWHWL